MGARSSNGAPARPLLFLHLPKTGGTTVRKHLEQLWGPGAVSSVYGLSSERSFAEGPIPGWPVQAVFTHGRIGCLLAHPQAPRATMLRHPVDRLLSHYRFARTWPDDALHADAMRLGPVAFAQAGLRRDLIDGQTWLLSQRAVDADPARPLDAALLDEARDNLAGMHSLGLSERFDESLALLCVECEIPPIPYARRNTSIDRAGDALGSADRAAIAAANPCDVELYAEAQELFADRWRAGGREAVQALAAIRRRQVLTSARAFASDVRARGRRVVRGVSARRDARRG